MPCFVGSGNIPAAQVNSTWWGRAGMEVAKRVEGQVGTTQGEAGRMNIGIPRSPQGGRTQNWEVVVAAEVRNTHSGPASIRERHEWAVARIAQAAWPCIVVGGVDTGCIRPWGSLAHTLLVHTLR